MLFPEIAPAFLDVANSTTGSDRYNVTDQCRRSLEEYSSAWKRLEPWAMRIYDSSGKPGPGLLTGELTQHGNYDECLNTRHYMELEPRNFTHAQTTQFCSALFQTPSWLTDFVISLNKFYRPSTFPSAIVDLCVPSSCSEDDLTSILSTYLKRTSRNATLKSVDCYQPQNFAEDIAAIVFVSILATIIFLVFLGTSWDFLQSVQQAEVIEGETSSVGYRRGSRLSRIRKSFTHSLQRLNSIGSGNRDEYKHVQRRNTIAGGYKPSLLRRFSSSIIRRRPPLLDDPSSPTTSNGDYSPDVFHLPDLHNNDVASKGGFFNFRLSAENNNGVILTSVSARSSSVDTNFNAIASIIENKMEAQSRTEPGMMNRTMDSQCKTSNNKSDSREEREDANESDKSGESRQSLADTSFNGDESEHRNTCRSSDESENRNILRQSEEGEKQTTGLHNVEVDAESDREKDLCRSIEQSGGFTVGTDKASLTNDDQCSSEGMEGVVNPNYSDDDTEVQKLRQQMENGENSGDIKENGGNGEVKKEENKSGHDEKQSVNGRVNDDITKDTDISGAHDAHTDVTTIQKVGTDAAVLKSSEGGNVASGTQELGKGENGYMDDKIASLDHLCDAVKHTEKAAVKDDDTTVHTKHGEYGSATPLDGLVAGSKVIQHEQNARKSSLKHKESFSPKPIHHVKFHGHSDTSNEAPASPTSENDDEGAESPNIVNSQRSPSLSSRTSQHSEENELICDVIIGVTSSDLVTVKSTAQASSPPQSPRFYSRRPPDLKIDEGQESSQNASKHSPKLISPTSPTSPTTPHFIQHARRDSGHSDSGHKQHSVDASLPSSPTGRLREPSLSLSLCSIPEESPEEVKGHGTEGKASQRKGRENIYKRNRQDSSSDKTGNKDVEGGPAAKKKRCFLSEVLMCFSFLRAVRKVVGEGSADHLFSLNGVRVFSITWIVLGNTLSLIYANTAVVANRLDIVKQRQEFWFQAPMNATFAADTFFILAGCLVSYHFFHGKARERAKDPTKRLLTPKAIFWFYFHRLMRILPCYYVALFSYTLLTPYFGDGPRWNATNQGLKHCRDHWWANAFFFSNFYKPDQMCMSWSYYLVNDMQFYILSPIVLYTLLYKSGIGLMLLGLLVGIQIVCTGLLTGDTHSGLLSMPSDFFANVYAKPYCRVAPFAIGVGLGYFLQSTGRRVFFRHKPLLLGWLLSVTVVGTVVYITFTEHGGDGGEGWSSVHMAVYEALSRPAFSLAVAFIIFTCSVGQGGFVYRVLSWNAFLPLCRITYGVYLLHPILITVVLNSSRYPFYFHFDSLIYMFVSNVVCGYCLAFFLITLVECPFTSLEALLRSRFS